ncbi:Aliphatic amidase expression-regulating protein [Burkholderiales bacterium]|nr:MAG: ABC transporter substrate-binding protein [Burkholderiales bacterium]CAG0965941.1 Aliphatic amidase expression-regulating protein [Burkholderiales bacterium]
MARLRSLARCIVAALLWVVAALAVAENGVSDREILLGQSAAFTGTTTGQPAAYRQGAQLYFDRINRDGGVHGRKIKVVSLDDGLVPERAAANAKRLIEKEGVFALVNFTWTKPVAAVLPIVAQARVPFFGAYTGFDGLYAPGQRYVFTTRASFRDELQYIIHHLTSLHLNRIGLVYYDIDGSAGLLLDQVTEMLRRRGLKPAALAQMKLNSGDAAAAVGVISAAKPDAVIIGTSGRDAVAFVRGMAETSARPMYYARSLINTDVLYRELGPLAVGIAVTETAPNPYKHLGNAAREYRRLLNESNPKGKPQYIEFEGYLSAKVLVEALRRAGKTLTRAKFIAALESMSNWDAGGYVVDYSAHKHHGSRFVDIVMIGRDGRIVD